MPPRLDTDPLPPFPPSALLLAIVQFVMLNPGFPQMRIAPPPAKPPAPAIFAAVPAPLPPVPPIALLYAKVDCVMVAAFSTGMSRNESDVSGRS